MEDPNCPDFPHALDSPSIIITSGPLCASMVHEPQNPPALRIIDFSRKFVNLRMSELSTGLRKKFLFTKINSPMDFSIKNSFNAIINKNDKCEILYSGTSGMITVAIFIWVSYSTNFRLPRIKIVAAAQIALKTEGNNSVSGSWEPNA